MLSQFVLKCLFDIMYEVNENFKSARKIRVGKEKWEGLWEWRIDEEQVLIQVGQAFGLQAIEPKYRIVDSKAGDDRTARLYECHTEILSLDEHAARLPSW